MKRRTRRAYLQIDQLESRAVPTTLIAIIDSGIDPSDVAARPQFYDMQDAYNAHTGETGLSPVTAQGIHGAIVAQQTLNGVLATKGCREKAMSM
jgi:hypothetical protein